MRCDDAVRPRVANRHKLWCARALGTLSALMFGGFAVQSASAQHCMYEIVAEISTPGCPPLFDVAPMTVTAMNDHGVVVGHFIGCNFDNDLPFMWSQETGFVAIPLPPGVPSAEPMDINNNGEIVGRLVRPELGGMRAFHYKDGVWTELPPTGNGVHSEAFGINDDGWVCGYRDTDQGRLAFRWHGDAVDELVSPIGGGAVAMDVNESAHSTGMFGSLISGLGFLWKQDQATEIPPLPGGTSSEGRAINKLDVATGQSRIDVKSGSVPRRSWVYQNRKLVDLGTLPGFDHRIIAFDINNATQVVGRCSGIENAVDQPFLWQHGQIHDIQPLITNPPDGLNLADGYAINNSGLIVVHHPSTASYLLAPVDRPLGDANIDCVVDERDLIAVLDDWGPDKTRHPTDMVTNATFQPPGDGIVDGADLAVVLGNWSISTEGSTSNR